MSKHLHIIAFDVPYPPNYGGVIDVYYKIKDLHNLGVKIHLHLFEYGRGKQDVLNDFCKEVSYYKRKSFVKSLFSKKPFMVTSRTSSKLVENLNKDVYPILFEGLHTTAPLLTKVLIKRPVFVRAHNVEHHFYAGLAASETSLRKRRFYKLEAKKLKKYEKLLKKVNGIFSISPLEQGYFKDKYGDKSTYIPAFHNTEIQTQISATEPSVLYHGNLSVSENNKAARFLIDVYKDTEYKLIIASNFENEELKALVSLHKNIEIKLLKDQTELTKLFDKVHINALPTFQNTGIKLKLLNTLYQGNFIIANDTMVEKTGLESLCTIANTKEEFLQATETLLQQAYTQEKQDNRLKVLKSFDPLVGAQKIVDVIFK